MDWYDLTDKYHELTSPHNGNLDSLPEEWQRELAAVWRMEADINNGGYLQFVANWGLASHRYGLAALKKMGANQMAKLVSECHKTLASAVDLDSLDRDQFVSLLPNAVIDFEGNWVKESGSILPDSVLATLYDLSYEFMDYPDDLPDLGLKYYGPLAARDG